MDAEVVIHGTFKKSVIKNASAEVEEEKGDKKDGKDYLGRTAGSECRIWHGSCCRGW